MPELPQAVFVFVFVFVFAFVFVFVYYIPQCSVAVWRGSNQWVAGCQKCPKLCAAILNPLHSFPLKLTAADNLKKHTRAKFSFLWENIAADHCTVPPLWNIDIFHVTGILRQRSPRSVKGIFWVFLGYFGLNDLSPYPIPTQNTRLEAKSNCWRRIPLNTLADTDSTFALNLLQGSFTEAE